MQSWFMPDVLIQLLMVPYFTLTSAIWMTNMVTIVINDFPVYMFVLRVLKYKTYILHPDYYMFLTFFI